MADRSCGAAAVPRGDRAGPGGRRHRLAPRARGRHERLGVLVLSPFSSVEGTGAITRIAHGGGKVSVVPFQAVRVKKRPGANPFRNMVTIGRAGNNDIELKASEVSKFHGYLTTDPSGAICYADAGSTNGSSVNGVPIPAKSTRRLAPGDELSLGGILVTFHDPYSFYGFLRAVVGDGEIEEA